jgi:hypothetical protein
LGALIAIGLRDSPSALLAYPILAVFLAISWTHNDLQIAQAGLYVKYRIEEHLAASGQGWEHAILSQKASRTIGALAKLATLGMFWGSEALAVGLYLGLRAQPKYPAAPIAENVLLLISVVATAFTMWTMRNRDAMVREIERNMQNPIIPPTPHKN